MFWCLIVRFFLQENRFKAYGQSSQSLTYWKSQSDFLEIRLIKAGTVLPK